jgi:PAB-dependent poly(A)-specific ribonuclease subunit 2
VTENESKKKDYAALIQKFNRWLTNTVALEDAFAATRTRPARNGSGQATPKFESSQTTALVNQILALTGQTENVCAMCGHTVSKDFTAHVVDLVYPRKVRHTLLAILRPQIYSFFGNLGLPYTTTP